MQSGILFVLESREVKYVEIKQFVVVTDDPEFCLGTTLLFIDTRNSDADLKITVPSYNLPIILLF